MAKLESTTPEAIPSLTANICRTCKQRIRTMAFMGTGFCGEKCRKLAKGSAD